MAGTDMISQLPDSVLHHIMSFMKANAAVRTCLLSKRWRRLWASLKHLNFDFHEFDSRKHFDFVDRYYKFISRMLQERDNIDVDTFGIEEFYENHDGDSARAREWISYVVAHNARVIHFPIHQWSNLPQTLYTCASLEELHVYADSEAPMVYPVCVSLPRLRSLDLCLFYSQFLKLVLAQCPVLEDLTLSDCDDIDLSGIHFDRLRKLTVSDCTVSSGAGNLSAPGLESFSFEGSLSTLRVILGTEGMPSLTYASISADVLSDDSIKNSNCNIFRAISNVRKLEFSLFEPAIRVPLSVSLISF